MVIWKVIHLKNPLRRNLDLQDPFRLQIKTALLAQISVNASKMQRI